MSYICLPKFQDVTCCRFLGQRGYKNPAQRFEIAEACFSHLEMMVQLAPQSPPPEAGPSPPPPAPPHLAFMDLLGEEQRGAVGLCILRFLSAY